MTTRTRAAVCTVLLLVALAFRLALAIGMPNDEPDDARFYTLLARNVLLHGVYSGSSTPPLTPTYVRVPGYPLFIAGIYRVFGVDNDTAVRLAQAVIETATCWMVACLALALAPTAWPQKRRRRVQCAALGLAAVCPFTAIYVTTLLTEVLAIALGTAIAWFTMRALREDMSDGRGEAGGRGRAWVWWFAAGLAGGALTIVRPEGGLLTAGAGATMVLAAVWQWRSPKPGLTRVATRLARCGVPLVLGFLVCDGPWIIRNATVFGVFQPTAPRLAAMPEEFVAPGYGRWLRTWVNEPKYVEPFEFDQDRARFSIDQLPPWAFDSSKERQLVAELFSRYNDGEPGRGARSRSANEPVGITPELDAQFETLARDRIRRHPVRYYVSLPAERVFWMWAGPHSQYYPFDGNLLPLAKLDRDMRQHIWLPIFALLTLTWSVFGVAGAVRLVSEPASRFGLVLLAMLVVPRLVLLGTMENPEPRFMVELFPFLSVLAGVAMSSMGASGPTAPSCVGAGLATPPCRSWAAAADR
jgi:hypothetical protein